MPGLLLLLLGLLQHSRAWQLPPAPPRPQQQQAPSAVWQPLHKCQCLLHLKLLPAVLLESHRHLWLLLCCWKLLVLLCAAAFGGRQAPLCHLKLRHMLLLQQTLV
jgi:hypothetical protein